MDNNYVLITGASSGIGYELAKLFKRDGYNLILVARNKERLKIASDRLKDKESKIIMLDVDLSKEEEIDKLIRFINENKIEVDIIILLSCRGHYDDKWLEKFFVSYFSIKKY